MDNNNIVKNVSFMKTLLKKPTILQMGVGLFFSISKSFFNKKKKVEIQQWIGKYKLVSEVKKENLFREYLMGIYEHRGEKVFTKTWTGFVRDFQYYELINEYFMTKELYKKFGSHKYIKIPKIISYESKAGSFSIIYEFIDGKNLLAFPRKKQVDTIRNILNAFDSLSSKYTKVNGGYLSKRTLKFYILSLTFLSILNILSNPRSFKVVLRGYIEFIKNMRLVKKNKLIVAHRDLSLHNIIVKGRYIFLIDCARVTLTYGGYDIAYILTNPKLKKISKEIVKGSNYAGNVFLENYILINQARSFGDPTGLKNTYLEKLHKKYGKTHI